MSTVETGNGMRKVNRQWVGLGEDEVRMTRQAENDGTVEKRTRAQSEPVHTDFLG